MSVEESRENEARIRELTRNPPVVAQPKRKQRFLNGLLYVMTAVTLALVVATTITYTKTSNTALRQSKQNHQSQVDNCVQSNQSRAQIKKLWHDNQDVWLYLVAQSKKNNPHPTPQQAKALADFENQIDGFLAKVDAAYAPRDCSKV